MRLLSTLAARLQAREQPCLLVGVTSQEHLAVDLVNLTKQADGSWAVHAAAKHMLPHGLGYVGLWVASTSEVQQLLQSPAVRDLLLLTTSPKGSSAPMPAAVCGSGDSLAVHQLSISLGSPSATLGAAQPAAVTAHDAAAPLAWLASEGLALLRVQAAVQLTVFATVAASKAEGRSAGDAKVWAEAVHRSFQSAEKQLQDPQTVFVLTSSSGVQTLVAPSSSGTVSDSETTTQRPAMAQAMVHSSTSSASAAPVLEYRPIDPGSTAVGPLQQHSCTLELHALAYVGAAQPLDGLGPAALQPALVAQLQACREAVLSAGRVVRCTPHHFLPPGRSHHLVLTYPSLKADAELNEAALAPLRRELHSLLGLPLDRPALKASNALPWPQPGDAAPGDVPSASASERLRDVHIGLPLPGPSDSVHLVQGAYEYFHYMQDRFDDSGWGCAYRSLQTICSWFRLQGYTAKPSPSHRQIQETLVRMGDKERAFIGSNQWIGAIELSYILDDSLGVTCKILTINRGADIPSHARELVAHFKNQGTPVMIGGGVLAYTLLGMYFNESTGDCAFLILDPHYTGTESLPRIHKGSWVGWKRPGETAAAGGPLFVQDAFYNFLCPQRPKEV